MASYRALVVIRILWCVLLQTGYIHPDEFFQNPEPMAGDVFFFKVQKPWEFNSSFPCRSVVIPYLTSGIVFKILSYLDELGIISISTCIIVVLPRLVVTVMSLIIDYSIYRICRILNLNAHACLTIFASSFVTLVFYTRTLSNSIEAILFAALLMLVIDTRKGYFMKERDDIKDEAERCSNKDEEKKRLKQGQQRESEIEATTSDIDSDKCFLISLILVTGIFNRPTFVLFAVVPMSFWLNVGAKGSYVHKMITNGLRLVPGVVFNSLLFIVADSRYYGFLDTSSICCIHSLVDFLSTNFFQNITVTPLNFIMYNLDSSHLAEHGLHPHITHLFVNAPLLFLPLMVCFASEISAILLRQDSEWGQQIMTPIRVFLQLSFFTPLLLLSVFPHQEPRFLIPLLIPLVLLYSSFVMSSNSWDPNIPWIVWNLIACLVFGVLHQGGMVPCISHLNRVVSQPVTNNSPIHYHIVFYHTYMPPEHLFAWREPSIDTASEEVNNILSVYDLAGTDRMTMHGVVEKLVEEIKDYQPYRKEIFIVSPSSLDSQFCRINMKFNFELIKQFTPHLSTEDLPELLPTYNCIVDPKRSFSNLTHTGKFMAMFSLNLYRVVHS